MTEPEWRAGNWKIMKKRTMLAVLFVLGPGVSIASAASGNASGPAALALAGVVATHSSVLSSFDRRAMARLLDGHSGISFPPGRKISVTADSIVCRASNVVITARTCELAFLEGREANERATTLVAAGVTPEGAAGSIVESVTRLACTVDPTEIRQKAGGGAQCAFEAGQ
jgi:hypothetical protein